MCIPSLFWFACSPQGLYTTTDGKCVIWCWLRVAVERRKQGSSAKMSHFIILSHLMATLRIQRLCYYVPSSCVMGGSQGLFFFCFFFQSLNIESTDKDIYQPVSLTCSKKSKNQHHDHLSTLLFSHVVVHCGSGFHLRTNWTVREAACSVDFMGPTAGLAMGFLYCHGYLHCRFL